MISSNLKLDFGCHEAMTIQWLWMARPRETCSQYTMEIINYLYNCFHGSFMGFPAVLVT